VIGSHHSAEGPAGVTVSPPRRADEDGIAGGAPAADEDLAASAPSECAGPIAIPPGLTHTLRSLARAAAADDFAPLAICATVLAGRLSQADTPFRARVIYGLREADTPSGAEAPGHAVSFHAALRSAARYQASAPDAAGRRADVTILVSQDGSRLFAESMTDSANAPSAPCWARTFLQLLTCLADEPDAPMDAHPLIGKEERDRILNGLNPYHDPVVTHRTMTEPFEEQAERTPEAVALVDEYGGTLSYRKLNEHANRLAQFLRGTGAGPGGRVGICLRRGIPQIMAIYAAVKAGAAYVPLDPELPDARLAYMLEDCAPTHVLTDPACRDRIPCGPWQVHDIESDRASWEVYAAAKPAVETTSAALLNILYTSGSTGRPKGVAYPVDGALAHLAWMQGRYPFGDGDTALFKTSPGFDVSIWEIFWPLYHGGRLLICRPGGHRDPRHLAELVETHGITTIFLPPTTMTPFLSNVSSERAGALRWVLCGGEPITSRIRDGFYAALPTTTLVNCYGPTEAGTVTDGALGPEFGVPVVPLGRPAAHFRLAVLDENLEPAPAGMPGEAYIGGRTGLAQGYWRAPDRTAERFVADPYGPPGSRMYRTGDLCRYRDDGVLEHLGRIDRQIKRRGMRVEPGEIESVLAAHPAVADCAVVAHGDPARLLAFVVHAEVMPGNDLDAGSVLEHAVALLPEHMRPDRVVPVASIPVTVNGKVDSEALLAAWRVLADRDRDFVPPVDDLEARLAGIYSRVLETAPVGMLDTFTRLGGHSMLAFQLLDECEEQLRVKPPVTTLLTGTVRDVAVSIRTAMAEPGVTTAEPVS
jgi:amino acid adenylation domain-containing protein